jgi:hypothetical protein
MYSPCRLNPISPSISSAQSLLCPLERRARVRAARSRRDRALRGRRRRRLVVVLERDDVDVVVVRRVVRRAVRVLERRGWCSRVRLVILSLLLLVGLLCHGVSSCSFFLFFFLSHPLLLVLLGPPVSPLVLVLVARLRNSGCMVGVC